VLWESRFDVPQERSAIPDPGQNQAFILAEYRTGDRIFMFHGLRSEKPKSHMIKAVIGIFPEWFAWQPNAFPSRFSPQTTCCIHTGIDIQILAHYTHDRKIQNT
jgi:hypothetical protein